MTVYNGDTYLAQAMDSLLRQSLQEFEIIVVNDGSTDSTPEILSRYSGDSRVRISHRSRIGRARALNEAWRAASSPLIAVLDADDLAEPGRLAAQLSYLERETSVGVLGSACRLTYDDHRTDKILRKPESDLELRSKLIRQTPFVHSSVMMRRVALETVGGYNETMRVQFDNELWGRMAQHCRFANLPDILAVKRYSRHAYFQNQISRWEKCRTKMRIRRYAWRNSSGGLLQLRHVFLDPALSYLYGTVVGTRRRESEA